ncbi:MAG: hypothetical protein KAH32_00775 [Chlamydiia bacterium]|nr:hypothetical protein [Chlamydiia bacterium]
MSMIFQEVVKLMAYLNPLAVAPILLSMLGSLSHKRRRVVVLRELSFLLLFMLTFLVAGKKIIDIFGLSIEAVKIGGAIILGRTAIEIMDTEIIKDKPKSSENTKDEEIHNEPFLIPIAMPLLFGPAVMGAIISMSSSDITLSIGTIVIFICWILTTAICLATVLLGDYVNPMLFNAASKVGGLVVMYLAAQLAISAIISIFHL